jgi:DNA polymerase-1
MIIERSGPSISSSSLKMVDGPIPSICVARELRSGRTIRQWRGEFGPVPPYGIDADCLFVAYYASAELGCHLALDWPMPTHVLDLFTEFRNRFNGLPTPAGSGLLGALTAYGLDHIGTVHKDSMRYLILGGGPWDANQRAAIFTYCAEDVDALVGCSRRCEATSTYRGRYMAAAARMEWTGTPIDTATLSRLRAGWDDIKRALIEDIDRDFGVFEGRHSSTIGSRPFWCARASRGHGSRAAI